MHTYYFSFRNIDNNIDEMLAQDAVCMNVCTNQPEPSNQIVFILAGRMKLRTSFRFTDYDYVSSLTAKCLSMF
jgi:hypothetical protein